MSKIIGAQHEFHSSQYARDWSARFDPTPERVKLFDIMIAQLKADALAARHIVELGIGPGYLASRVLDALAEVTYEGVDYSQPMLDLGASRLREYAHRVRFTRADLVADRWDQLVERPVGAVVSTWALHDLGGEENTAKVYRACKRLLPPGGIFLNGDFIKPDGAKFDYEPGRFAVARHIEILSELGFQGVECLGVFETELDDPTPAQNYALIKAVG